MLDGLISFPIRTMQFFEKWAFLCFYITYKVIFYNLKVVLFLKT